MKILLTITLLFFVNLQANELEWVDRQVEAIKPSRAGMDSQAISQLRDPFIFTKKKVAKPKEKVATATSSNTQKVYFKSKKIKKVKAQKREVFYLSMTMNRSAMINQKWYKVGDTIKGYKISKIELSTVTLTKNKHKLLLSTNSKNLNLKFK